MPRTRNVNAVKGNDRFQLDEDVERYEASDDEDVERYEESDDESVVENWETVSLTNSTQAADVYRSLLHSRAKPHQTIHVRNLWIHSDRRTTGNLTSAQISCYSLGEPSKIVAHELAGKKLENLAIDVTLLSKGWIVSTSARPNQILLLENEDPWKPIHFDFNMVLFNKVKHLVVAVPWVRVAPNLSKPNPLRGFKSLTHLCVRFSQCLEPPVAIKLVGDILKSRKLAQLVVCIDSGISPSCTSANPLWMALTTYALRTQARMLILPRAKPMSYEWKAIVEGGRTVWERAMDPDERVPAADVPLQEEDFRKFHGTAHKLMGEMDVDEDNDNDVWLYPPSGSSEAPEEEAGDLFKIENNEDWPWDNEWKDL